jgi:hypothetical protein
MSWIAIALTLVVVAVIFAKRQAANRDGKRSVADLGAVSSGWLNENRRER